MNFVFRHFHLKLIRRSIRKYSKKFDRNYVKNIPPTFSKLIIEMIEKLHKNREISFVT